MWERQINELRMDFKESFVINSNPDKLYWLCIPMFLKDQRLPSNNDVFL